MRKNNFSAPTVIYFAVGMIVADCAPELFGGRCCEVHSPDPSCSGCVCVETSPLKYVHAGHNSFRNCVDDPRALQCDELQGVCFSMQNADVYADESCAIVVGFGNYEVLDGECSQFDDPCNAG